MALTFANDAEAAQMLGPSGIIKVTIVRPAAADYATGGYSISPNQFDGLSRIRGMFVIGFTGTAIGYIWQWNKTTSKLQVFQQGAAAGAFTEVATGTDLSGGTVMLLGYGF